MDLTIMLASVLGAASIVLISYGAWSLASTDRQRISWRVSRTGVGVRPDTGRTADVRLQDRTHAIFTPVDRRLARYTWAETSRKQLAIAEINLYLSEFIAIRVVTTAAAIAIPVFFAIREGQLLIGLAGMGAGLFVWWQFGASVRRRINRRKAAIEAQLDDALVNISGSLRAGFSFPQACQMAVPQLQWPLDEELRNMLEEVNVGASLDAALRNLAERVETYEMDITVNAVLVQRQVGGSLSEILDHVARTLRERRELRGHMMALTSQQRLSAYFVAGVPVGMAAFLSIVNWGFMSPMFTTLTGNIFLVIGAIFDMLGFLVMKRLMRVDF